MKHRDWKMTQQVLMETDVAIYLLHWHLPELGWQLGSFFSQSVSGGAVLVLLMQNLSQECPGTKYKSVLQLFFKSTVKYYEY